VANGHKLKIERGIPVPKKHGAGAHQDPNSVSGVLRRLQTGESVLVPGKLTNVSRIVGYTKLATGYQFTCRTVEGGIRVWRLS
jgi:hypothetical protein